jgi:hypothetical protein
MTKPCSRASTTSRARASRAFPTQKKIAGTRRAARAATLALKSGDGESSMVKTASPPRSDASP